MGKARSLRAPHLGSSPAARRSPLVGILSGVDPPHGMVEKRVAPMPNWRPARGCNITIKKLPFFSTKKKNLLLSENYFQFQYFENCFHIVYFENKNKNSPTKQF